MYSVVLMMALSGGADMPAMSPTAGEHVARYGDHGQKEYRCFGRRGGRGGCHGGGGCSGGYGGGCYGGGYGGCSGGGYGGCYGGGGYGGCTNSAGNVYSNYYPLGCSGGGGYAGCSGSSGGYGGCSGGYSSYGGGSGYYGSMPYATGMYSYSTSGAPIIYGSSATYGAPMIYSGTPSGYGYGVPVDQGEGRYYSESAERLGAPLANGEASATITVRLPADARLTVDGAKTQSTESVRTFVSPPLQPGKTYQYTLAAEVTRDGKKVERTRDVTVRAGEQSEVTIDLPSDGGSSNK